MFLFWAQACTKTVANAHIDSPVIIGESVESASSGLEENPRDASC